MSIARRRVEVFAHCRRCIRKLPGRNRKSIASHFRVRGREEELSTWGNYDRTLPLVIDPNILYSTMVGGERITPPATECSDASGKSHSRYNFASDFPVVNPVRRRGTANRRCFCFEKQGSGNSIGLFEGYLAGRGRPLSGNGHITQPAPLGERVDRNPRFSRSESAAVNIRRRHRHGCTWWAKFSPTGLCSFST